MPAPESNRILKANDARGLNAKIAFNYEDLRRRCEEHIEAVRQQARQLVEDAQLEAESIRSSIQEQAREAGYREGMQQASEEIERRVEVRAGEVSAQKLKAALPALQAAADALGRERDRWLAEWESTAVRLCVAIAEKLIRRELAVDPHAALEMIVPALELGAGNPEIRVRMHSGDIELLGEQAEEWVKSMAACGRATLVPDSTLSPGSCVIETNHGIIDARLETQLERITAELTHA